MSDWLISIAGTSQGALVATALALAEIRHSAEQGVGSLAVFGAGVAPHAFVEPQRLSFGEIAVETSSLPRTLRVRNAGSAPLRLSAVALSAPEAGPARLEGERFSRDGGAQRAFAVLEQLLKRELVKGPADFYRLRAHDLVEAGVVVEVGDQLGDALVRVGHVRVVADDGVAARAWPAPQSS